MKKKYINGNLILLILFILITNSFLYLFQLQSNYIANKLIRSDVQREIQLIFQRLNNRLDILKNTALITCKECDERDMFEYFKDEQERITFLKDIRFINNNEKIFYIKDKEIKSDNFKKEDPGYKSYLNTRFNDVDNISKIDPSDKGFFLTTVVRGGVVQHKIDLSSLLNNTLFEIKDKLEFSYDISLGDISILKNNKRDIDFKENFIESHTFAGLDLDVKVYVPKEYYKEKTLIHRDHWVILGVFTIFFIFLSVIYNSHIRFEKSLLEKVKQERDIKGSLDVLEADNAFLLSIIENTSDAIIGYTLSEKITSWNKGASDLFGLNKEETIGRDINYIFDDKKGDLNWIFDEVKKGRKIIEYNTFGKTKDGKELNLSLTMTPVLSSKDDVIGTAIIARDISNRLLYEKELKRQEKEKQLILDSIDETVLFIDREFKIIWSNDALKRNFPKYVETGNEKCYELFHELDNPCANCVVETAFDTGRKMSMRQRFGEKMFFVTATPVFDEKNDIIGAVETARDINDIYEYEKRILKEKEKAEKADRLKSEFLANMSHEIRTPMTAILGYVEMIGEEEINDEVREYLEIIERSSEGLLDVINDIIDISKIEAGQLELKIMPINPREIIEDCVNQNTLAANRKGIKLKPVMGPETNKLFTDIYRVEQIMNNIISNAIKFTDQGFVSVGYDIKEGLIEFFVKDTGVGIPQDFQDKVFLKFVQVDSSNTRKYGGTGLGLTISKNLIELLDGDIYLESVPEKGTTVFIQIPLGKEA